MLNTNKGSAEAIYEEDQVAQTSSKKGKKVGQSWVIRVAGKQAILQEATSTSFIQAMLTAWKNTKHAWEMRAQASESLDLALYSLYLWDIVA